MAKNEITANTYRRRFCALDINQGKTPLVLYVRLKDLFDKWVKPESSTVKEISELLILEQFWRMVGPELEVWICGSDPKSAEDAARLAEVFLSARTGSWRTTTVTTTSPDTVSPMGVKGVVNLRLDLIPVSDISLPVNQASI